MKEYSFPPYFYTYEHTHNKVSLGLEGGAIGVVDIYPLASQLLTSLKSVVWVELHWN